MNQKYCFALCICNIILTRPADGNQFYYHFLDVKKFFYAFYHEPRIKTPNRLINLEFHYFNLLNFRINNGVFSPMQIFKAIPIQIPFFIYL